MSSAAVLDRIEQSLLSGSPQRIAGLQELIPELQKAPLPECEQLHRIRRLHGNLRQFIRDLGLPCCADGNDSYDACGQHAGVAATSATRALG